ncbi:MAG: PilZ domain-containing protein [Rhizobiaceae bacterium]|nr:PilZ domain-containing protein [Rhizobiaceae bacterium]
MAEPEAPLPPREHRARVLKGATIILDVKLSEINCVVRNQNTGGAELNVPIEAILPEKFLVYIPVDRVAYKAVLRWRRNQRVGVQFVGTEPKPRMHYGF